MSQPTQIYPDIDQLSTLELAQALAERLVIAPNEWHKLKGNRTAQARQQVAAALIFLLKEQPNEALLRLQQASGWLERTVSAPPCPDRDRHKLAE